MDEDNIRKHEREEFEGTRNSYSLLSLVRLMLFVIFVVAMLFFCSCYDIYRNKRRQMLNNRRGPEANETSPLFKNQSLNLRRSSRRKTSTVKGISIRSSALIRSNNNQKNVVFGSILSNPAKELIINVCHPFPPATEEKENSLKFKENLECDTDSKSECLKECIYTTEDQTNSKRLDNLPEICTHKQDIIIVNGSRQN